MAGPPTRTEKRLAVIAAIGAGACWGVSFVAPRALPETTPATLAFFRFFFFALPSGIALFFRRKSLPRLSPAAIRSALGLSLGGFSLYYALLAIGVQGIGVPFATAIIALLPLTILLASTPVARWRSLGLPIALIAIGGVLVPMELFGPAYSALLARTPLERVLGLVATLSALALWTVFAVRNALFLKRNSEWKPLDWAGVLGMAAGATAFALFLVVERERAADRFIAAVGNPRVLAWTGFMGVAGAWIAGVLWNFASRVLPAGALGMLLVFEAIFGLAFGFLYDGRGPTPREALAAGCLIAGALIGIRLIPNDRPTSGESGPAE